MLLLPLTALWLLGIFLASVLHLPAEFWLLLLALPFGYLLLFWRDPPLRRWHIVLLCLVLGGLRGQLAQPGPLELELAQFNAQGRASLVGVITAIPEVRASNTVFRVDVAKIQTGGVWQDVHGRALVYAPRDTPVRYGDEVQVDGAPELPPDGADFSYRDYLARQSVFTLVRYALVYHVSTGHGDPTLTALYGLRDRAATAIGELLPEPSAALLTGILLGDDNGLPPALRDAFNRTNTSHVIAISGFNIAVVVGVLAFLLRRPALALGARALALAPGRAQLRVISFFARHVVTALILLFLVLYTLLVGAQASVVRACIMGGLTLLALALGRRSWAFTALALAAFAMSLLNPFVLWDAGFQLSFLATLGLLIYAPLFQRPLAALLARRPPPAPDPSAPSPAALDTFSSLGAFLNDAVVVTAAAFIATAPLTIALFHRLSLVGFLTNLLILPVQPAIMFLGGLAASLGVLSHALTAFAPAALAFSELAQVLAWAAYLFLQYTILVVQFTAALPLAALDVPRVDLPLVVLTYALLFGLPLVGFPRSARLALSHACLAVPVLAILTALTWTVALAAPDPRTHLTFIAATSGDATFIRTVDDRRILVNGTSDPTTLLAALGSQLPPWDRRLDLLVATHLDAANLSSLNAVLDRYAVGQVLAPALAEPTNASQQKWRELLSRQNLLVIPTQTGVSLRAGSSRLDVVYPPAPSDSSPVVLSLTTGGRTLLLAPALRASDRAALLRSNVLTPADLAVLPNDLDPEFLSRVSPRTVILFSGASSRDRPTAQTLALVQGASLLRTDLNGTVSCVLAEDRLDCRVER